MSFEAREMNSLRLIFIAIEIKLTYLDGVPSEQSWLIIVRVTRTLVFFSGTHAILTRRIESLLWITTHKYQLCQGYDKNSGIIWTKHVTFSESLPARWLWSFSAIWFDSAKHFIKNVFPYCRLLLLREYNKVHTRKPNLITKVVKSQSQCTIMATVFNHLRTWIIRITRDYKSTMPEWIHE